MSLAISTERLELQCLKPGFLRAVLSGDCREASRLVGADVPEECLGSRDVCRMRLKQLAAEPALQPWLLRAMIRRTDRQMVGHLGFHTGPDAEHLGQLAPGGIEFGYTVFTPYRRQGFAREAVAALMRWATTEHGIRRFVVSIRPDNTPSLRLAAQYGFQRIGEHLDEVDGLEYIFRLDVA